ncbi:MAG: thioredoxin fold domain-containing protein [Desulfamplus sp.]|nr:thioredoxin fold domain-containing protein [Desulfamplus sp.]
MKNRKSFFAVSAILIGLILTTATISSANSAVQWKSYEEGIAMAKAEKKNIFLYFHADWCGYCHQMDSTTFKDNGIQSYLNDNYITIRVDSDRETKVASNYGVRGLPTSWFLKSDSEKLSSMPGFVDAKRLLTILKYVNTESYKKMSYRDFEKSLK